MPSRRTATLTTLLALALSAALAGPALAVPVAIPGAPLTVYVDELGQLQAKRDGGERNIFFNSLSNTGDAGFFLAFPAASGAPDLDGHVYGFSPSQPAGAEFTDYAPIAKTPPTGGGTAADPLEQVTTYAVNSSTDTPLVRIKQTTSYVNGAQQFGVRWDVTNNSGAALKLKALAAADFYFDGSDVGTGIFTEGPPRFVGGTNADTGNSGGFAEVTGGPSASPPWSKYEALAWGGAATNIWPKVAASASTSPTFNDTVNGQPVDNAGGVEWDQYLDTPIPNTQARSFELTVKNAVPALLQLTPSNAGSPRGVPVNVTATAVNTEGVPYAGRSLKYEITGANPGTGALTLDANGQATVTDPGTAAGADTIVAFVDFNNDGVREPAEPQASSLATFVDQVAPTCTVKVSGDRPGGGGPGKPLKITVSCNESATVTVATTLSVARRQAGRSTAGTAAKKRKRKKPIKIKLKARTQVVAPGASVPVRIKISKQVRRKYAGRKVKATVTVTARDSSGNVKKVSRSRTVKLAKLKKKAKKKG